MHISHVNNYFFKSIIDKFGNLRFLTLAGVSFFYSPARTGGDMSRLGARRFELQNGSIELPRERTSLRELGRKTSFLERLNVIQFMCKHTYFLIRMCNYFIYSNDSDRCLLGQTMQIQTRLLILSSLVWICSVCQYFMKNI